MYPRGVNVAPGARVARLSPLTVRRLRRVALSVVFGALVVLAAASLVERHIESDEIEAAERSQSFAEIGSAHVRYQLTSADKPGPVVVLFNGMAASLEQWQMIGPEVAAFAPTLIYDRGGCGYSYGSSAHSAGEQADELAALLAKLSIDRPLILVGYSVSASIARVFVARHRAMVAGVVLLEPYLPELQGRYLKRDRRLSFTRWLVASTVSSFLGLRRFEVDRMARRGEKVHPPPLRRFSHWWAVDRELLATPETQTETLTADPLGNVPLVLLTPREWESGDAYRELGKVYREFVKTSNSGSMRYLPDGVDHGEVVEDPRSCDVLVNAVHDLATQPP